VRPRLDPSRHTWRAPERKLFRDVFTDRDPEAERVLAGLRVAEWAALEDAGTLASAKRLAAQAKWREALDGMIGALRDDPEAREAMLDVFAVLGDDDPLVADYRRRLANALF